ncbi:uncharacterized protein BCR38DRAFT_476410 [Pseudomassariella vexata]|uniref:Uncharacterized protein n=1 Tax=Pseudomassariella vexata TaxID=1141098 RepID=A0A1Y2DR31_9PEZI|nr:uncharacterized protein BCR38DRAFT_476410 [Pseudomassariella vexata]ORY61752.1 hypothetical protein BCR38DRAFT_476410 [Pseudomassariella vexata]
MAGESPKKVYGLNVISHLLTYLYPKKLETVNAGSEWELENAKCKDNAQRSLKFNRPLSPPESTFSAPATISQRSIHTHSMATDSSSPLGMREQLLKTTALFLTSFNKFTPESVVAHRSPKCIHRVVPSTIKAPPRNNAEIAGLTEQLKSVMSSFRVEMVSKFEPIVDVAGRKVVLHLRSSSETIVGAYDNEYMWSLTMNETGTEIDEVLEFADSYCTFQWAAKLKDAVKNDEGVAM